MSDDTGVADMSNGGINTSRLLNYLIVLFAVALVACGGWLAYLHFWQGEPVDPTYERSLEIWKQAVADDPDNSLARANLGATYMDMGRYDDAIRELEKALEMVPDSYTYTLQLGYAYAAKGDYQSALDMFTRSAENTPAGEKYIAYYEAADAAYNLGDTEAAVELVQKSIEDNDTIWNSHLLLGRIYEESGDNEKALAEYQAAARFNPADEELQEAIARLSG